MLATATGQWIKNQGDTTSTSWFDKARSWIGKALGGGRSAKDDPLVQIDSDGKNGSCKPFGYGFARDRSVGISTYVDVLAGPGDRPSNSEDLLKSAAGKGLGFAFTGVETRSWKQNSPAAGWEKETLQNVDEDDGDSFNDSGQVLPPTPMPTPRRLPPTPMPTPRCLQINHAKSAPAALNEVEVWREEVEFDGKVEIISVEESHRKLEMGGIQKKKRWLQTKGSMI